MNKVADKEEKLRVLDENGNDTGMIENRSVVHEKELFHDEVILWIIDKDSKKVLLERRSPNKKYAPNKLGLCAGHVVANETIEEALAKEAREELGININNYDVKKLITIKKIQPNNRCFLHNFYILDKIPLSKFIIQEEELSEVLYMDYEKLKELVMSNDKEMAFESAEVYKPIFDLLDNIIKLQ